MPHIFARACLFVVFVFFAQIGNAADITIVSMQYSASHMVPHLNYDGPVVQEDMDALQLLYDQFVHCRDECATPDGRSNAVITLNSPGGDYITGIKMAHFLRDNHIAAVVESGSYCYSACAFAFLGGSGYSTQQGVGDYIDRVAAPGSTIGFHAPYIGEETLNKVLEELGSTTVMGVNRRNFALMVEELVGWNIDPFILAWMVNMGPDKTYDLVTPGDLYLTRAALPPSPASAWITSPEDAVRNVCLRLLAQYERIEPTLAQSMLPTEFTQNTGVNEFGDALSGYLIGTTPLRLGHCSVTEKSLATDGDYEIALYLTPGIDGTSAPILSFFNRHDGWSTSGTGASPTKRIFQKGSLNHFFLPPEADLSELDERASLSIITDQFFTINQPDLPQMANVAEVLYADTKGSIARAGDIWAFVQAGSANLFTAATQKLGLHGVTIEYQSTTPTAFVRAGTYNETGHAFAWVGFADGNKSTIVRIESTKPAGEPLTDEENALVRALQCGVVFGTQQLDCGG